MASPDYLVMTVARQEKRCQRQLSQLRELPQLSEAEGPADQGELISGSFGRSKSASCAGQAVLNPFGQPGRPRRWSPAS